MSRATYGKIQTSVPLSGTVDILGRMDTTTVLGKVMAVLRAFGIDDSVLSLAELSRRTSIPKGTLHRVAADMVTAQLLERSDGGYRLGGQLFELGMKASVERGLLEVAIPFLEDLYVRTRETVHLGVLEGTDVVYLSKIGGHAQAKAPSRLGGRMPLHCTAIGKALLAHADPHVRESVLSQPLARFTRNTRIMPGQLTAQLDRIVAEGVAYEFEESAEGIVCVAAPVRDSAGTTVAAVSVTGPSHRFRPELHAQSVRAGAAGIGAMLDRRRPPTVNSPNTSPRN